jgi:flagellar basal body-associated protein FliL
MSDEQQDLNLEEVGAGAEESAGPRRGGLLSGMLLTILKWAAIAVGVIILVVTATVITSRQIMKGAEATSGLAAVSPSYAAKEEPWATYPDIEQVRGQTADVPPAIFLLQVSLSYEEKKGDFSVEIGKRKDQIRNLLLQEISMKTADELQASKWPSLQEELLHAINAMMTTGKIKRVNFLSFVVQQ